MKRISGLARLALFCFLIIFAFTTKSMAAQSSLYNEVADGTIDSEGYYIVKADTVGAIRDALEEAKRNATPDRPYKIVVKPSDTAYRLEGAFVLYNNVCLYARDAVFKQASKAENNMIRTGNSDNVSGYYYKNIVIDGGIWDENGNGNTLIKIAQAENITIRNATFQNTKKGHLMEVAGVKGFRVEQCKFLNQVIPAKGGKVYEAIQLDILVNKHFTGYRFQDLPIQDVTIDHCVFNNVPRGVGSHTTVLNNPINGIRVTNNTFSNIKSCAVQLMNVVNCTVSDNVIKSSPRGITILGAVFDNQDTYLASTLSKSGHSTSSTPDSYKAPALNMNIVIKNNHMKLAGKDPYATYERSGILLNGYNVKKAYKSSSGDKIPKGNYYISGAEITGNVVQGNSHGVKLVDVRKCKISENKMDFTGAMGSVNYYGITLKGKTKNITISSNKISKYLNGIYVKDASAGTIAGNRVTNVKKYGISIERSTATQIKNNTVYKTKKNGIHIWDKSKVKTISKNQVTSSKARGIYVGGKSTVTTISGNKMKSCKEKIYINKDSKVKHRQKV